MLRQKLLLVLGVVVALMLAAGIIAVVLLQSVLNDLEHFAADAFAGTSASITIQQQLAELEWNVEQSATNGARVNADTCAGLLTEIDSALGRIGELQNVRDSGAQKYSLALASAQALSQETKRIIEKGIADRASRELVARTASNLRAGLVQLQDLNQVHAQAEERRTAAKFRGVALGLGLAFVLVINVSIMVLARMTTMILRPVDQLVAASRRMAHEDFDSRVELTQQDEFGELAQAYNSMAAALQVNEQRKLETLQQAARMLNHELNNAIAIIQLQLVRSARSQSGDRLESEPLREIQQALTRMTNIVSALTRIRRIVLTDYLSGLKMLDLEASVAEESQAESPAAASHHHASTT